MTRREFMGLVSGQPREEVISFEGLTPADIVAALYNAAPTLGSHQDRGPLPRREAELVMVGHSTGVDSIDGRTLKLRFHGHFGLDVAWYNLANGPGKAQEVLDLLRRTGDPADSAILAIRLRAMGRAAADPANIAARYWPPAG